MERKSFRIEMIFYLFVPFFYLIGLLIHKIFIDTEILKVINPFSLFFISIYILFFDNITTKKNLLILLLAYIFTFGIEVIGVNTNLIFGKYTYGAALGIKIFNVPLLIGLNWIVVLLGVVSVLKNFKIHFTSKVILIGLIAVIFDIFLEIIAPKYDYWNFANGYAPFKNFLAWFFISIILGSIFLRYIQEDLRFTKINFISQFIFFVILSLLTS